MIGLKNVLYLFLLVLAIGLSGWSIFLSSQSHTPISSNTTHQPDAFMEGIVAIVLNKLGAPTLKLETPKMIHFPENDATELVTPNVTVFRESQEPWHIRANHAKTLQGINEITFWDNVVIHHLADRNNPLTTMHTSTITILPKQQTAKTNEAITVIQPNTKIQAIGMRANWEQGIVNLLSNAREEYVPNS